MALGVPGRLRPWIFSTLGTTRVVGRQPNAPAAFTPGKIPGTHFQRLSRPHGTWFCRKEPWKKSQVIPPGTVRPVAQRLNHYATPGPNRRPYSWKVICTRMTVVACPSLTQSVWLRGPQRPTVFHILCRTYFVCKCLHDSICTVSSGLWVGRPPKFIFTLVPLMSPALLYAT